MNLLPKTHEEFSHADYWNTFFKKRGKKVFEWYGEYPELCEILLKYIKIKDDILIVGCGNSTLSMSLYDVGYRNIINIDISHIVIKQMRDINNSTRPNLVYEHMDATKMTYPDEKFSVILDKGTLDALMPDAKETTISTIDKYFKEITRVLRNGGRYICISLLQEHILRKLLSYFPASGFMFRISRCHEAESKARLEEGSLVPIFVIIATKFIRLSQTVCCNESSKICHIVILALAGEMDWLFSTKEGRQQVLKSAKHDRLAIVTLRREHKFESWDAVKTELQDCVRNLAPAGLSGKHDIPFLSLGSDVGARTTCYEGKSDISGPFVVEEVEKDGHEFRRLVFLNNPYVIQSEARLKEAKSRRGKTKKITDPGLLACEHHIHMSVGVSAVIDIKEEQEIMIIGLGGGALCMFLHHCFPKLKITAVEIDNAMLKMATEYFNLILDDRMKVEIADGIRFIKDAAACEKKYKAILFDIDSKDTTVGMSCPPKQFLELSILKTVAACLTEDGLFILNLVSRDRNLKQRAKDELNSIFQSLACYTIQDEVNEIVMCSVEKHDSKEWRNKFKLAAMSLNNQAAARKLFSFKEAFNIPTLLESLSIS
ncbi:methyltransferase-like protein 13 isoform x3 protein [Lasius niger]|uniref:Methyltransferase-like protein 13 isoform x3 protein n=1 Tax=Lasius niger TaxID=67767 RepID=A0A0J7NWJ9_LASNI|nr:methyltransferase-like protein 13 isoform x3 protein [Lasius niger]